MVLKKLQLLWIGLTLSLIFFIAGFNFDTFTAGSHSHYASEIVCSGPSRDLNCSLQLQADVQLFRGSIDEPTQLPNHGSRYTSSSFANFLNLFITSTDSLRTVILKVYVLKSILAAYIITYSLFLIKKFAYSKHLAIKLFLTAFSFPYLIQGMSGVYPAPIAIVAVIPILISLKIFQEEKHLTSLTKASFLINFFLCLSVVMANRFETTVFVVFGISVWVIFQYLTKQKINLLISSSVLFCLALFTSSNATLRHLILKSLSGHFSVLTDSEIDNSVVAQKIGDFGLSLIAPITFIDNSSRNFLNSIFDSSSVTPLKVVLLIAVWIPLVVLLRHALRDLFMPLIRNNFSSKKLIAERIPGLLCLGILVAVPVFARTVWFFWYVLPVLLIFIFFTSHLGKVEEKFKLLILFSISVNALSFILSVLKLGNLEIGGFVFNPPLQIVLGLSLGLIAVKLVKDFLLKATVKTFNT